MYGNVNVDYRPCKSSAQLRRAADYLLGRQAEQIGNGTVKTAPDLYWSLNCDRDHFARDVLMTRKMFGKKPTTNANLAYKMSISFSPEDNDKLTYQEAFRIAKTFAERFFQGYEVLFAVHTDTPHKHVHFLIGNCNLETGRAFRRNERDLREMSEFFGAQCMQRGLVHSVRQDYYNQNPEKCRDKETFAERQMKARGKETFKDELREVIQIELGDPDNRTLEDVVNALMRHYHVECRVRGNTISYRHPGFTDKNGKPVSVRGSKLGEQYTVKGIQYELNKIQRSKEAVRTDGTQPGRAAPQRIFITGGYYAGTAGGDAVARSAQPDDPGFGRAGRGERRGSQTGRARGTAGSSDTANVPTLAGLYSDYQRRNGEDRRPGAEEPEHSEPVRRKRKSIRR
ncbi:MAG: relaxase/mobilization nuclease domain-containing protein [Oscillospiraceae bacterium]|nr:relaxase/mobilization nuclease domain-containing protein [Oscillospiraceae bacterium]